MSLGSKFACQEIKKISWLLNLNYLVSIFIFSYLLEKCTLKCLLPSIMIEEYIVCKVQAVHSCRNHGPRCFFIDYVKMCLSSYAILSFIYCSVLELKLIVIFSCIDSVCLIIRRVRVSILIAPIVIVSNPKACRIYCTSDYGCVAIFITSSFIIY